MLEHTEEPVCIYYLHPLPVCAERFHQAGASILSLRPEQRICQACAVPLMIVCVRPGASTCSIDVQASSCSRDCTEAASRTDFLLQMTAYACMSLLSSLQVLRPQGNKDSSRVSLEHNYFCKADQSASASSERWQQHLQYIPGAAVSAALLSFDLQPDRIW